MLVEDILNAVLNKTPMMWNDPDPIEGNDYTITKILNVSGDMAVIQYGVGSEAEVYISEISVIVIEIRVEISATVTTTVVLGKGETVEDVLNRDVDIYLHGRGNEGCYNKLDLGVNSLDIKIL